MHKKKKEERTSAVRQLFHYSECKIIRYYTNHSDGLPAKNCVDYTVDTLVSTAYITGVSTAKTESYRLVKMRQRMRSRGNSRPAYRTATYRE